MNMNSITVVLGSIWSKDAQREGVSVASILVARNITILIVTLILLRGRNPFHEFPWGDKNMRLVFLVRALTG